MKIGEYAVINKVLDCTNKKFYKATKDEEIFFLKLIQISDNMVDFELRFLNKWETEASFQKDLKHPNILKFIDRFDDKIEISKHLYECKILAYEYCETNLHDMIYVQKITFDLIEIRDIIGEMSLALRYLNDRHIIHGDISARSILVKNINETLQAIKLCDFGSAIHEGKRYKNHNRKNSIYLAPELMQNDRCTSKADVFSFGCVIYELVKMKHPFTENKNLLNDKLNGNYDKVKDNRVCDRLWRLVNYMLRREENRLSVKEFLAKKIVVISCLSIIRHYNYDVFDLEETEDNLIYINQRKVIMKEMFPAESNREASQREDVNPDEITELNNDASESVSKNLNEQKTQTDERPNIPLPRPITPKMRTSSIGENIKFFVGKFEVLDENAKVSSKTLIRCKNDEKQKPTRYNVKPFSVGYRSRSLDFKGQRQSQEEITGLSQSQEELCSPTEVISSNDNISRNEKSTFKTDNPFYKALNSREKRIHKDNTNIMDANHFNEKGIEFLRQNKLNQAIINFDKAIDLDGKQDCLFFNKANALYRWSKYKEAANNFNKAILLNPKNAIYYYYKAICLKQIKSLQEAKLTINKAIQLDSNNSDFYLFKSKLLDDLNQKNESHFCATKATQLNPENPECLINLGLKCLKDGEKDIEQLEDSVIFFKNACQLERNPVYFYYCAYALTKLRKYKAALKYINEAVKLDEENFNYLELKNHIICNFKN